MQTRPPKVNKGRTPLELARERGYEEVARMLVQAIEQQAGRREESHETPDNSCPWNAWNPDFRGYS